MNVALLTKVTGYLASHGVKPENTDEFKMGVVSLTIKGLIDVGMTVPDAVDEVLGAGSFNRISDDCWETLNR